MSSQEVGCWPQSIGEPEERRQLARAGTPMGRRSPEGQSWVWLPGRGGARLGWPELDNLERGPRPGLEYSRDPSPCGQWEGNGSHRPAAYKPSVLPSCQSCCRPLHQGAT